MDRSNVTPLRREPAPAEPAPVSAEAPPAPASVAPEPQPEAPRPQDSEDWISPFEDELDVPTFLRKQQDEEGDEEEPWVQSSGE